MEEEHKVLRLVEVVVPQVGHVPAVMDREVGRGFLRWRVVLVRSQYQGIQEGPPVEVLSPSWD